MTANVNRRSFVKTAVAGSAVFASSSPLILGAQDKAGSKEPIVGSGEHTYRCIHHWGRDSLPTTHDYGNASHGVTIDNSGMIYITHTGRPDSVYKFDPDGKFIKSMAGFHAAKNRMSPKSDIFANDMFVLARCWQGRRPVPDAAWPMAR